MKVQYCLLPDYSIKSVLEENISNYYAQDSVLYDELREQGYDKDHIVQTIGCGVEVETKVSDKADSYYRVFRIEKSTLVPQDYFIPMVAQSKTVCNSNEFCSAVETDSYTRASFQVIVGEHDEHHPYGEGYATEHWVDVEDATCELYPDLGYLLQDETLSSVDWPDKIFVQIDFENMTFHVVPKKDLPLTVNLNDYKAELRALLAEMDHLNLGSITEANLRDLRQRLTYEDYCVKNSIPYEALTSEDFERMAEEYPYSDEGIEYDE